MGTQLCTHAHAGGGFFASLGGPASRPPELLEMPRPAPQLAGRSPRRQGQGLWSCSGVQWCTPLLRPDWPTPRGEAARVASGPDCRPRATTCPSRLAALPLTLCAPAPGGCPHHAGLDGTMGISFGGWMREVTGLGPMGPCPLLPHLAPGLSLGGYPVQSPAWPGFCPCRQVRRGEIP